MSTEELKSTLREYVADCTNERNVKIASFCADMLDPDAEGGQNMPEPETTPPNPTEPKSTILTIGKAHGDLMPITIKITSEELPQPRHPEETNVNAASGSPNDIPPNTVVPLNTEPRNPPELCNPPPSKTKPIGDVTPDQVVPITHDVQPPVVAEEPYDVDATVAAANNAAAAAKANEVKESEKMDETKPVPERPKSRFDAK